MEGTIGEIRGFAGNFAPKSWAYCNGQLLAINTNQALYSILGTTYGGDGRNTFALPDLRGRVPVSAGQRPGFSNFDLGQQSGSETNTLLPTQMPNHTHTAIGSIRASNVKGTTSNPANGYLANSNCNIDRTTNVDVLTYGSTTNENMAQDGLNITVGAAGGSQPFNNMQPYLAINWVICLNGVFPSRN